MKTSGWLPSVHSQQGISEPGRGTEIPLSSDESERLCGANFNDSPQHPRIQKPDAAARAKCCPRMRSVRWARSMLFKVEI
jgi:hypothetical protein